MKKRVLIGFLGLACGWIQAEPHLASGIVKNAGKLNVLFIAVDDLRPELNCYGKSEVISPNMDKLAADGLLFERAYCQLAVCAPSRASLLTGMRPDTNKVLTIGPHFRTFVPDVVTLPQHFKNNGYHTQSLGKIYHGSFQTAYMGDDLDDPPSWSVPSWRGTPQYYFTEEGMRLAKEAFKKRGPFKDPRAIVDPDDWPNYFVRALPSEAPDVPDNMPYDGQLADKAIEALRELSKNPDKPFFLGVGFLKPHLPFVAPKKYWDLYKREEIQLAENPFPPENVPSCAMVNWGEMRSYTGVPKKGAMSDDQAREMIHGYRACVSYIDAMIGKVIDELDRLGLRENTVIVLWGDHGWKLGEHSMWSKHTNFELDARVPLIISAPSFKGGLRTQALSELVDIYPTLCELCNLSSPDHLEGSSFVPLMKDPEQLWKAAAFSQIGRNRQCMGYSMRTDRWRYTRWQNPKTGQIVAEELYDHINDPAENINVAGNPENAGLIRTLSAQLDAGWKGALPSIGGGRKVQVELQDSSNVQQQRALEIFTRIVRQRTGLEVVCAEKAALRFGFRSDIGTEGFSIEEGSDGQVIISGNELPGLLAGVGKFLRTARLETGVFEPGTWRGESVPKSPIRGVYFATHFFNWYHQAPIEEIRQYIEELSLWGCNTICVWFDMHHYQDADDPKAQEMLGRLREILKAAQDTGLKPALTLLANEAYASSPKELRASTELQNGYVKKLSHYRVEVCPNIPGGMEYILQARRSVLAAFQDIDLQYICVWPYDQGGCTCDQCAPWGSNGFLKVAPEISALSRELFPRAKTILSTWYFDRYLAEKIEWPAFDAALGEDTPAWLDYLMVDDVGHHFPAYPLRHGAPGNLPMLNFPEISMLNNNPWGGYGANPSPVRMGNMWAETEGKLSGGWPYSEGIYEDLNKAVVLQLYWNGQDPRETVREYMAYEFSPDAAEDLTDLAFEMEQSLSHRCRLPQSSQSLAEVLYAEPAPILYHTPNLGDAASRLQRIQVADSKLDSRARSAWRWRILHLRAKIDAELQRSGGCPNERLDRYFEELNEIYYADQAINLLRPPSRSALMDLYGGRNAAADTDAFNPAEDEKIKVSSCLDPSRYGPKELMDGVTEEQDSRNFWAGFSTPGKQATVTIDLESVRSVGNVALQYRNFSGKFLFVPAWISTAVSQDGVQFSGDEARQPVPVEGAAYNSEFWSYPVNASGRFIRITLGPSQYRGVPKYAGLVEITEIKVNAVDR